MAKHPYSEKGKDRCQTLNAMEYIQKEKHTSNYVILMVNMVKGSYRDSEAWID